MGNSTMKVAPLPNLLSVYILPPCPVTIPWQTLKPIDEAAIIEAAETGAIVTAEEHLEHGGLGSAVARVVARHRLVPMEFVAIKECRMGYQRQYE